MDIREDFELLGDPKKFQKVSKANDGTGVLSSSHISIIKDTFQILEKKSLENKVVLSHPREFKEFIIRNIPEILSCFEKTLAMSQNN